jgi:energy-coupling factor transport system substrate-specific component
MKQIAKFSIFLIPVGVAVNFVGAQIAMLLKLPIYLDAIGTFVVGALCGGIPGAIVGVVSNTINSITYPTYIVVRHNQPYLRVFSGLFVKKGSIHFSVENNTRGFAVCVNRRDIEFVHHMDTLRF